MLSLSSAEKEARIEGFLAATNARNVEQALSFVDQDAQLIVDGEVLVQGKEQIRQDLTNELAKPEYSSRILWYLPSRNGDENQLTIRGEMKNKQQYEETFVFSKEYPTLFCQFIVDTKVDQL